MLRLLFSCEQQSRSAIVVLFHTYISTVSFQPTKFDVEFFMYLHSSSETFNGFCEFKLS